MTRRIRIAMVAGCLMTAAPTLLAQDLRPLIPDFEQGGARPNNNQQGNPKQPLPPGPNEQFSPVYIQELFDTMAIKEAEHFLPLSNDQYPVFVQRLQRLQQARMTANRRRGKAMNELRPMVGRPNGEPTDVPDAVIDAKLKELAQVEADGQAAVRKALEDLDVGLNVRQRARFRMLEENVERRKIDFLTKVRGGGAGPGFEGIPR